jgi:hypothetical protein
MVCNTQNERLSGLNLHEAEIHIIFNRKYLNKRETKQFLGAYLFLYKQMDSLYPTQQGMYLANILGKGFRPHDGKKPDGHTAARRW